MKAIVDVLGRLGELVYWRQSPAPRESGGIQSYPPIITLRYKLPSAKLAEFLASAVNSFPGSIPWELAAFDNNVWCLMPARIEEYSRSHNNLTGLVAREQVMIKDPDFGEHANAKLPLLLDHIQRCAETSWLLLQLPTMDGAHPQGPAEGAA